MNGGSGADERGKDHVDTLLDTKEQVGLVLLRDGRKIHVGSRQIDALLGAQSAAILHLANETVALYLKNENLLVRKCF